MRLDCAHVPIQVAHLIRAVIALVTDADERARAHVRVADDALPVTYGIVIIMSQPPV